MLINKRKNAVETIALSRLIKPDMIQLYKTQQAQQRHLSRLISS